MEISEEEVKERFGNKNITYYTIPVIDKEAEFRKYIKMCDCPEIQEGRKGELNGKWQDGDVFEPAMCATNIRQGFYGNYWTSHMINKWEQEAIWLPRQDQFQEMIEDGMFTIIYYSVDRRVREGEPYEIELYFNRNDAEFTYYVIFTAPTLEQLLLKAVMRLKYNKVWNNDKWEGA